MSMRREYVASTSIRRHFGTKYPQGTSDLKLDHVHFQQMGPSQMGCTMLGQNLSRPVICPPLYKRKRKQRLVLPKLKSWVLRGSTKINHISNKSVVTFKMFINYQSDQITEMGGKVTNVIFDDPIHTFVGL